MRNNWYSRDDDDIGAGRQDNIDDESLAAVAASSRFRGVVDDAMERYCRDRRAAAVRIVIVTAATALATMWCSSLWHETEIGHLNGRLSAEEDQGTSLDARLAAMQTALVSVSRQLDGLANDVLTGPIIEDSIQGAPDIVQSIGGDERLQITMAIRACSRTLVSIAEGDDKSR